MIVMITCQFGAFFFGARQFDALHFDAVPVRRVSVWRDASLARFTLARFPFVCMVCSTRSDVCVVIVQCSRSEDLMTFLLHLFD